MNVKHSLPTPLLFYFWHAVEQPPTDVAVARELNNRLVNPSQSDRVAGANNRHRGRGFCSMVCD